MDAKAATADWRLGKIAARQHGVVYVKQLHGAGISRDSIRRRVETGRLHHVHRGVYAVGHPGISLHGRWMAAVLACGRGAAAGEERSVLGQWGAALSHRSAAELWGLLAPRDGPVHISVPSAGGRDRRRGIRLHRRRSLSPAAVTRHNGIPVTTPARTIADLRRAESARDATCRISARELRRAIRQADVLNLPLGTDLVPDRTRSDLELAFLRFCRTHGLPEPQVNVRIESMLVDFTWPRHGLAVETDGYRYHRGRAAFEEDRARDLRLRTLGYDVVRLSGRQVEREPERVAAVLRGALACAGTRPAAP
jgi:very-short-patch-repair endonuclease